MTSDRDRAIEIIQAGLGSRDLVWFGTRGDDAEGLADIDQLSTVFSIISQYRSRATVTGYALERFSGVRVDLDAHDIDEDLHRESIGALRRQLLATLASPCVVMTYRPSTFLSAACFARTGRAEYLGMFKDHQSAFEHKPWVETGVASLGLPRVPWRYVPDSEQGAVRSMFRDGPIVVRRSRSSGGTGIARVDDPTDLAEAWPRQEEEFVSVAPFIENAEPVNVGAVVWDDGVVTVDYPSLQLIGVPELTARPFGYCGNDFASAKSWSRALVSQIEEATTAIGAWMGRRGYRGAFGVDFLVQGDTALFMEVNARFQGSTHATSRLARSMGESCIMTDHLMALLHHEPLPRRGLWDRIKDAPELAHIVLHRSPASPPQVHALATARALDRVAGFRHADVLHSADLECDVGATVGRFTFGRSVTTTGFDLAADIRAALSTEAAPSASRIGA